MEMSIEARFRLAGEHTEVRIPGAWAHEAAGQIEHMKKSMALLMEAVTRGRLTDPMASLDVVKIHIEEAARGGAEDGCGAGYDDEYDDDYEGVPSLADLAKEAAK